MSRNVRQVSIAACVFLVLLRVAIGWQFLYEGLWKLGTQNSPKPWSAEGYLLNARGPLREKFRNMTDDADGLKKLDHDYMLANWDDWKQRFVSHYGSHPPKGKENLVLQEDQIHRLDELLDGPKDFRQPLAALPKGVDLKKFKVSKKFKAPDGWFLTYDSKAKRLVTNLHLVPEERDALLAMAIKPAEDADPDTAPPELTAQQKAWKEAVEKLFDRTSRLSLRERLQVLLKEDPERVGYLLDPAKGEIDPQRPGKKKIYEHLLAKYEQDLKNVKETFQQEHLDKQWRDLMAKKGELVGPVDALTVEFQNAAYKLLTPEQATLGPVPPAQTQMWKVNQATIWSLIVLGALMMVGFFSRLSSLGAAGLLLLFYLPMPPWPGVPEAPGPEHSLFVNKNLIEVIACLALVALPTGRWMGLDALVRRFVWGKKEE